MLALKNPDFHSSEVFAQTGPSATPVSTPDIEATNVGEADTPLWSFVVRTFEDPYVGELVFPADVPADRRVVGAEVIIINGSDQPLDFQTSNIHLVDSDGVEYIAGNAQGSEPRVVSQVLPDGERTRGSVWFIVPAGSELIELRFYAPAPKLRVQLEGN